MLKFITITIFLFLAHFNYAQDGREFILFGIVKDGDSKEKQPIPNVKVVVDGNKVFTNENGEFSIKINYSSDVLVEFKHVGYNSSKEWLTKKMAKRKVVDDTLFWNNILLKEYSLETFYVTAFKVDTVFGSVEFSVEDYVHQSESNLLLLAYEKTLQKQAKLLLVNKEQTILANYTIPNKPMYLYTDYAENNYVVCENAVYKINIRNDEINLLSITLDDFYGFHQRVIDTIGDNYYYSNYNELYPAVKFYVTERNDTVHTELYEVKDDFMMELYRAQYKYVSGRDKLWAYRKEQQTGIDKEIWIGASSFTQDILYKPVYAPLFVINDTVLIFDQYKDIMVKIDEANDKVNEVYVGYHKAPKGEKWEQPVLKDKKEQLLYGVYNGGGYTYVKQILYNSGNTGKTTKLRFRFVEKIKIYNGYVYYIYRPFESSQKKFIYKEKLAK